MGKNESDEKKRKMSGLHISLIMMTIFPVIILGLAVNIFVYKRYTNIMYKEVKTELRNTALIIYSTYENAYPGEYSSVGIEQVAIVKGEKVLNGNNEIIDEVKAQTGCDITLFYGNVRVITTLEDENGDRMAGTTARTLVFNEVKEYESSRFYSNSTIGNKKYFSYYMPITNRSGKYIGMIAVAKPAKKINSAIANGIIPIIVIVFGAIIIMAALSYKYTNDLIVRIKKVKRFLEKTESGDFTTTIDEKELEKKDEITEMCKSAISMQRSLRKLVEQDMLTGINNRRYGDKFLFETQKRCLEEGMPFCVAIADIDFFKKVNDTYGHEAGDRVLIEVANILKTGMVGKGFVARWGGEEFLLVFDKDGMDASYMALSNILNRVRQKSIYYNDTIINVTMTSGITEGTDEPVHSIVNRADGKLYDGKQSGRDRIIR